MAIDDIVNSGFLGKVRRSILARASPYLISAGLAFGVAGCQKDKTFEATIKHAVTDSEGKAYFTDDQTGEDVVVTDSDHVTGDPIEGADVTFIDSDGFEAFTLEKDSYVNAFNIFPHNSNHDFTQTPATTSNFTVWDDIHDENPGSQDAWENFVEWLQGSDQYQYEGCYTREQLIEGREDTMQLFEWLAGGTQIFKLVSAVYDGIIKLDEWGIIEDLPYDYYDVYSAKFNSAPTVFVGREEPCPDDGYAWKCSGDELFCDDFNDDNISSTKWDSGSQYLGGTHEDDGFLQVIKGGDISYGSLSSKPIEDSLSEILFETSFIPPSDGYRIWFSTHTSPNDITQYAIRFQELSDSVSVECSSELHDYNKVEESSSIGGSRHNLKINVEDGSTTVLLNGDEIFYDTQCFQNLDANNTLHIYPYNTSDKELKLDYVFVE